VAVRKPYKELPRFEQQLVCHTEWLRQPAERNFVGQRVAIQNSADRVHEQAQAL
jgi:hypothetical protein